jgi:hypothetical protein
MNCKKIHYLPDYACGRGDNDIQYTKCAVYVPTANVTRLWREVTCKRCLGERQHDPLESQTGMTSDERAVL